MICGCDTSYIVSVHIQCQVSIYTYLLCRGHSWRVRLAMQEMLTPPGTWSHLWFAGVRECPPWCSIVGATVTMHQFCCIFHCYTLLMSCYMHIFVCDSTDHFKALSRPSVAAGFAVDGGPAVVGGFGVTCSCVSTLVFMLLFMLMWTSIFC